MYYVPGSCTLPYEDVARSETLLIQFSVFHYLSLEEDLSFPVWAICASNRVKVHGVRPVTKAVYYFTRNGKPLQIYRRASDPDCAGYSFTTLTWGVDPTPALRVFLPSFDGNSSARRLR